MIDFKGRLIPQTFEEIVNPKHTALIVHEMLNDFIAKGGTFDKYGGGRSPAFPFSPVDVTGILGPTKTLLAEARERKMMVIYVRYTLHADYSSYSDSMIQRGYETIGNPKSPPPPAIDGTWGWENIEEVKPQEGEIIIKKNRNDCFLGTNFELMLRSNGIRTIVIVGIGAEAGIVPTVNHAFNLGFFSVVPSDCVRAIESQWFDIAMKFITRSAIVKPSSDVIKAWQGQ